jgi:hypothetical protein
VEQEMSAADAGYGYAEDAAYEVPQAAPAAPGAAPAPGGVSVAADGAPSLLPPGSLTDKIIYFAAANVETVAFDDAVAAAADMILRHGAFIESSHIGGRGYEAYYYGYNTYRTAQYTIRVPRERFEEMTSSLSALGSVTYLSSNAQNVTAQYTDTESRLKTYRVEESRLLAMLEKADTVTDMIAIESRLSDVRYNVETLESSLRNLQNQVDYSTVQLTLNEVEKITPREETRRTYWQQLGDGLKGTLAGVGDFFKELFKGVVVNSPVLLILAAVAAAAVVLIKKKVRAAKKSVPDGTEEPPR